MPAYNFSKRFAPLVETGQKRQTIRKTARGAKRGDTAYLYTGQRTVTCRKLGEGVITEVMRIEIANDAGTGPQCAVTLPSGELRRLIGDDLLAFARADGFANTEEFVEWFADRYGLPFRGYVHQWVSV